MKKLLLLACLFLLNSASVWCMDGGEVANLLRARVDERAIINTVQRSPDAFRLDARDIDRIRREGGSEYLIQTLCGLSRPPIAYVLPAVVVPAPVVVQPAIPANSVVFTIVNRSNRHFTIELDYSDKRIIFYEGLFTGIQLQSGMSRTEYIPVNGSSDTWKAYFNGKVKNGNVEMRRGCATNLTLTSFGNGGVQGTSTNCKKTESFALVSETPVVIVAPPPPVIVHPAPPVVVARPPVVVHRPPPPPPVVVVPARPGPGRPGGHHPPPPIVTPMPGMPPVVVAPPPKKDNKFNIKLSF